jgi:histidine phosphotransferase ChpT
MDRDIDPRVLEFLCSHLCHELISPVTAVNNGLELMGEGDASLAAEALGLIRQSAAEASRKLQFYRLAYGQAAGFEAGRGLDQARELCEALLKGGKISLAWAEQGVDGVAVEKQSVKLMLNIVALARDALPRGGTIGVRIAGPAPLRVEVAASGTGARIAPEVQAAMAEAADVGELTPRTVHAYLVAWLARRGEAGLAVDSATSDRILFRAGLRAAG